MKADLQDATGKPCVHVWLTPGNPNTNWTQAQPGYFGGQRLSVGEVLSQVAEFQIPRVEVGGGDPLAQPGTFALLEAFLAEGLETWLQTPAQHDLSGLDPTVNRIVNLHTPESGRSSANRWDNLPHLQPSDQLLFVLTTRHDYEWAKNVCTTHGLIGRYLVRFIPATPDPKALVDWVIDDAFDVRVG